MDDWGKLLVCGAGEAWEYYTLFSLPVEMDRAATVFGGQLIANSKVAAFPQVADSPGYRFQMQYIQFYSVTTGWMSVRFGEGLMGPYHNI